MRHRRSPLSEIILFRPKAELDVAGNLAGFVASCRNDLTVFGVSLPFDQNVWDITESLIIKGHGNKRQRLVFSALASIKGKSLPPMREPFLSFAKAYLRYMQGFRPTKAIAFRLAALRALEAALNENGEAPDPIRTDAGALNRAAQLIAEHYTEGAAYRIGGQLEMIATFLADNRLTVIPVRWHSYLKRPGDAVRVGKAFDERRQSKMPSQEVLDALPKVFRLAKEPVDVLVSSIAAILCSSPDRISEVLLLPEKCEVYQKAGKDKGEVYGLRWWPAKGAEPMVKWIVPSMVSVVQEAIEKIRRITAQARCVANWYEEHPRDIYLSSDIEHLRNQEWLSLDELVKILNFGNENAVRAWCKAHGVMEVGDRGARRIRFADIQEAVLAMLPQGFPILDKETGLKLSEALLVVRINELHPSRSTYRCMIEPVSINQINSGLGGRVQFGFGSIFSRLGFADANGNPIKVTTHQFRHYLNTLAQAGGMSQLDIAKWSGRKDIRQNAVYNHVTPDQMLQKIRDAVGDDSQMFGPLAKLPRKVLIPRDEFARLKVPTAHTTDIGFCIHDYTMSPCQLHRDCIHCEDLVCIKGDEEKTQRLRQQLEEARALQEQAKQAVGDGYAGSDRWLDHHHVTVERLTQLCSIMDDPKVPLGSVIQLASPNSGRQIAAGTDEYLPSIGSDEPSIGLSAGAITSMEN